MSDQSYPPAGQGQPQGQASEPKRGSGMAVAALVLGLLALFGSITVVVGILFGLVAIILGFIASGRAKRGQGGGRGMAITGIVTGFLGVVLAIALVAVGVTFLNSDTGQNLQECVENAGNDQAALTDCQTEFEDDLTN